MLRPAHLAPISMPHLQWLKSPFFPILKAQFHLQQVVLITSFCLNAFGHMISYLCYQAIKQKDIIKFPVLHMNVCFNCVRNCHLFPLFTLLYLAGNKQEALSIWGPWFLPVKREFFFASVPSSGVRLWVQHLETTLTVEGSRETNWKQNANWIKCKNKVVATDGPMPNPNKCGCSEGRQHGEMQKCNLFFHTGGEDSCWDSAGKSIIHHP